MSSSAADGVADGVSVPRLSAQLLAALINEWATVPQELSRKPWTGFPQAHSSPREQLESEWPERLPVPEDVRIRDAADALYPLFALDDAAEFARRVNAEIAAVGLRPGLRVRSGPGVHPGPGVRPERGSCPEPGVADGVVLGWAAVSEREALPAGMLAALLGAVGDSGLGGLGVCSAADCGDIYIDVSPPRSRRYCTQRCQTRERVRAHRRRRADARHD